MGIHERKQRQREERKTIIQKAAIELFLQDGFENVTIRKIAEKIEYSPATIYLYYKDKSDILMALHKTGFEILIGYLNHVSILKGSVIQQMKRMAIAYTNFAIENSQYYTLIFLMSYKQKGLKDPDAWEEGRIAYNNLKENVLRCQEQNIIKSPNTEEVAFAIWSFLHGISSLIVGQNGGPVKIKDKKVFVKKTINYFFENIK